MAAPLIPLSNGQSVPALGLGTAGVGTITPEIISYAIGVGYRHIDTAWIYKTEKEVGEGIRNAISENMVKREDIFLTTKLWNTFHEKDQVVPACKESLKNLGLDYIDLYLIHWPVSQRKKKGSDELERYEHDDVETWKGMEECVKLGLVKSIGLSNFSEEEVTKILEAAEIKPVMNQIEVNPLRTQKKLIAFCKAHNIQVTAYTPLGAPNSKPRIPGKPKEKINYEDPRLLEIAKKYGKTTPQVVLRYLIDIGVIPIPKSTNQERIKQNIDVFDFKLSPVDIKVIDEFNKYTGPIDTSFFN